MALDRRVTKDERGKRTAHYYDEAVGADGSTAARFVRQRILCACTDDCAHEMEPHDEVVLVGQASGIAPLRGVSLLHLGNYVNAAVARHKAKAEAAAEAAAAKQRKIDEEMAARDAAGDPSKMSPL